MLLNQFPVHIYTFETLFMSSADVLNCADFFLFSRRESDADKSKHTKEKQDNLHLNHHGYKCAKHTNSFSLDSNSWMCNIGNFLWAKNKLTPEYMTATKVMHTYYMNWIILIIIAVIVHTKANRYNISNTGLNSINMYYKWIHNTPHMRLAARCCLHCNFHLLIFVFFFNWICYIDLQYCKEYDGTGENYSELFRIDSFKLAKNAADARDENAIDLRLYLLTLQGAQDARILLSPENRSPAYEIGVCVYWISH